MTAKESGSVLRHLSNYKKDALGIFEDGTYKGKEYSHILPLNKIKENLIQSKYRSELEKTFEGLEKNIHIYFHHLNSSQALALNLFVPLIKDNKLKNILSLIGDKDSIVDSSFEHIEDNIEKTNFDFFIQGEQEKFFFEVKYTESSFASQSIDSSHLKKYLDLYKQRLEKIVDIDMETFFKGYQLWRNIIYADKGTVIFVFPKYRSDLEIAVRNAISQMKIYKEKVKIIYIEDICDVMEKDDSIQIQEHYIEFKKKYFLS